MRLIVYGPFLIISFVLIQTSLAESKNYKRLRDDEDSSVERSSKYKKEKSYKSKYINAVDDDGEENYKIDKHHNRKPWEQDHDFTTEKKYTKYTQKFNDPKDEPQSYKTNKKSYDARKGKDSEGSGRTQFRKDIKEEKKHSKFEKEHSAEKTTKTKNKHTRNAKNDDNNEDSEEETVKFEEKIVRKTKKVIDDFGESEEEAPKKKFRKKIRVRIPDSPEDESDESDEDDSDRRRTCERKCKRGKDQKSCLAQESVNGDDETEDGPVRPKKIKYSIKFAHEKERSVPSEDDNIMLKIHRGEKKKYKYQDDDDDDSSEENTFPKRVRYVDDDEE